MRRVRYKEPGLLSAQVIHQGLRNHVGTDLQSGVVAGLGGNQSEDGFHLIDLFHTVEFGVQRTERALQLGLVGFQELGLGFQGGMLGAEGFLSLGELIRQTLGILRVTSGAPLSVSSL